MNSDQLFRQVFEDGRTHRAFIDQPVQDGLLLRLYDLAKVAPSASICAPCASHLLRAPPKAKGDRGRSRRQ